MNTTDVNVPALKDRVKRILTDPKSEWPVIEAEATTTEKLYSSYIVPLAAIPAIASFIGMSIIGVGVFYRVPIVSGIIGAIVSFVLTLVGVYVAALIVNKLAPTFDSTPNDMQALKLVAYAYTAAWVAGIFNIIPLLGGLLALIGALYSIYLFYIGLPIMMKTPAAKVIPYMVISAVVIIAISIVMGMIAFAITGVGAIAVG